MLQALAGESNPVSVSELSGVCGISRATLARLLKAMEEEEVVRCTPRGYILSYRIWSIASRLLTNRRVRGAAFPHLVELGQLLEAPVSLAVLDDMWVIYIETFAQKGDIVISNLEHYRLPAALTASGRAMLAFLPPDESAHIVSRTRLGVTAHTRSATEILQQLPLIKSTGLASIDRELEPETCGIAAPIFSSDDEQPVAAIAASWHGPLAENMAEDRIMQIGRAASAISLALGYVPVPARRFV